MPPELEQLFLFVPANRPERFAKAAAAGADAVIIDLEDAIAAAEKLSARATLASELPGMKLASSVYIRINAVDTAFHAEDVSVVSGLSVDGVLLPKAESAADIGAVRMGLPEGKRVLAIVETAKGLAAVDEIAAAADRLVFGSLDFAVDLGMAHGREALLFARSRIVMAARLSARSAPIDGVTVSIKDAAVVEDDARYGASLGFAGKLLIHPAQVDPARRGFAPSAEDIAWATRIVESAADGAARAVDGTMVDAPVLARARQILRAYQLSNGS